MKPVAFVTGGSRGIGFGIARKLAENGFDLAINGMRPVESVQSAIDELAGLGADVLYVSGDIGNSDSRKRMMAEIREKFGRLNWLVNNAGVAPKERRDILEMTEESFEWVVKTNLGGAVFLSQLAANWMVEQKKSDEAGSFGIINISSISATVISTNRGEYCMAKAGLSMATQLFATRLGEFNIPVYEVRPGVIKTDMTSGVVEKYDRLIEDGLCVTKRWGYPEDVAKAVGALARDDFPYSTGQVIMVDGGLTLSRL